jgi:DNA-binding MarR family transcriptional regulator
VKGFTFRHAGKVTDPDATRWGDALDRLLAVTSLLSTDMQQALAGRGLSESRTHVLWVLAGRGPVHQRVLADALGVSARAITGLVDALADAHLVTRVPHPTDRRAQLVTLTAAGHDLTDDLLRGHRELARSLFAPMPPDALAAFASGLDEVADRFRVLLAAATEPDGGRLEAGT